MCFCIVVFFFKQKTAYEMRISDWSSDVCSSDLLGAVIDSLPMALTHALDQPVRCRHGFIHRSARCVATAQCEDTDDKQQEANGYMRRHTFVRRGGKQEPHLHRYIELQRSEEHTSELQSLMRISYAVFCLKKKKSQHTTLKPHTP